jgi:hypothetical protein
MNLRKIGGWSALVLALATLALSGWAAASLAWPNASAAMRGLADVHETRATQALTGPSSSPESLRRSVEETRKSLTLAPANPRPWLRLAYIETLMSGGMTAEAQAYVERSYAVAPYGPDDTPWRLWFLFQHWDQLTPSLRRQAIAEIEADPRSRSRLRRQLMAEITNPSGRVAAALALAAPAS